MNDTTTPATVNNGRFTAGNAGRKPGSRNRATVLAEAIASHDPEAIDAIIGKVTDAAKRGEKWAIQIVMDKLYASPKDRAVQFDQPAIRGPEDLAAALDSILQATAAGQLTPSEAAGLSAMVVDVNARIMDDIRVYLDTVRKLAEADDKQGVMQLKAPYPAADAP